jgi:hypothetical protein
LELKYAEMLPVRAQQNVLLRHFKIKKMHAIVKDDCVMLPMSLDVSCSVCNDQAYSSTTL